MCARWVSISYLAKGCLNQDACSMRRRSPLPGAAGYLAATFASLIAHRPWPMRLSIDGLP